MLVVQNATLHSVAFLLRPYPKLLAQRIDRCMKTFTDAKGREWHIVLNVAQIKKIKNRLSVNGEGFDLLGGKGTFLEVMRVLADDPIVLVDTLYLLCEQQAKERNITDEQFGEGLAGNAIEQATDALLEEYVAFFPDRQQTIYRSLLSKGQAAANRWIAEQETKINSISEETLYDAIQQEMNGGEKSTRSRGKRA